MIVHRLLAIEKFLDFRYLKLLLNEANLIPDKYEDDKALILKAVFSSLNLIGAFEWQSRIRPQDVDVCYR